MIDTFGSSIIEWNGLGRASASFDELFAIERYNLFTTHTFPITNPQSRFTTPQSESDPHLF